MSNAIAKVIIFQQSLPRLNGFVGPGVFENNFALIIAPITNEMPSLRRLWIDQNNVSTLGIGAYGRPMALSDHQSRDLRNRY